MFISQINTPCRRLLRGQEKGVQPWAHVSQRCLGTGAVGEPGGFLEEVAFEVGLEE